MKLFSESAERNKLFICRLLRKFLPGSGKVVEIASGSGQHIIEFAKAYPHLKWQPTELEEAKIMSIKSYSSEAMLSNILSPIKLDVMSPTDWESLNLDMAIAINLIHITPRRLAARLFSELQVKLSPSQTLFLYGPFKERGRQTAESNLRFDEFLKSKNADYGLWVLQDLDEIAMQYGFKRLQRTEMPANNLSVVFERV